MNYDIATERYIAVRSEIEALEREHKATKAKLTEKLVAIENWITAKAQEDGLETVKTPSGTGYW